MNAEKIFSPETRRKELKILSAQLNKDIADDIIVDIAGVYFNGTLRLSYNDAAILHEHLTNVLGAGGVSSGQSVPLISVRRQGPNK